MKPLPAVALLLILSTATLAQVPSARDKSSTSGETSAYRSEGRRDPFVRLADAGVEARPTVRRVDGPGGLATSELSIRGILAGPDATVAMIQGPDKRTYLVRTGERLADGVIKAVIPQGLVILQEFTDPTSSVRQREVRKLLRSVEDARP